MLNSPLLCLAILASSPQVPKSTFQKRDLTKGNTMYVVPYAHLDTQWRWAYPQVIREYIPDTLNKNFALIDKYPNYIFNFSGSRRYQFMKEYYPGDYEKLKTYIKNGRWFPCGSSVDEGDANVPSAESLIRHQLYGNKFFKKEFGVYSQEFMLPDCFGFPYALPSILAHCGTNAFSTQKLTWGSAVGIPFKIGNWEGPDGKSVVAALDPGSYAGDIDEDLSENTSWLARIQNTGKLSGAFVDYHYYGTGDIGGGPTESSVDWVEKSIAGKGPITVVSSRADDMFRSLTPSQVAKLPRYKGELLLTEHSSGSITSQAYMKRWNRKNELLADAAERASVAAMWLGGRPYPSERLYNAWDLVLGSQMHDMLPGTSIPKAYEFCWNDELLALNQFAAIETDALGAVTSAMDTRASGTALVVYNPLSIQREDVVEATIVARGIVPTPANPTTGVQVFDRNGQEVPTQVIGKDRDGNFKVIFLAKVPSCGFAVYDARLATTSSPDTGVFVAERSLENHRFKVTVNEAGDISSIFDKQNNREVLKSPARLDFQYHNPSAFPAWNMDWEDAKRPPAAHVDGPAKITTVERGSVRSAIRVERESMGSRFVQEIRLAAGNAGDRVEIYNLIDWQTKEHALKASFPLTSGNPLATYDLQLGAIQRGNNDEKKYEVPQHMWIDLSQPDDKYGVGILNDSKYGSDKPNDDTVRLTMIYTPGVRGGYWDQFTQDFGRHEILYAIAPHAGDWRATPWVARRLNQPMQAFAVPSHEGPLGKSFSLLTSNTNQVEITAIKKAEDSKEVIVRLRELEGKPADVVRISMPGGISSAREVDGQERPIGAASVKAGELVTSVQGFSLRAFAITPGRAPARVAAPESMPIKLTFDADVASTRSNPKNGAFGEGAAIAAETLPKRLVVGGVPFELGPTKDGANNALIPNGQSFSVPSEYQRVYILAATTRTQREGSMMGFPDKTIPASSTCVGPWDGFFGLWDNRIWNADVGRNFTNYTAWNGLEPGFTRPFDVAWFSNHKRNALSGDEHYEYCYLYRAAVGVTKKDEKSNVFALPIDPDSRVLAITAVRNVHDAIPVAPLYDMLEDRKDIGAAAVTIAGRPADVTTVTIAPPLYWDKDSVRYTTDGSDPNVSSPTYHGPFTIYQPTTIKVANVRGEQVGPVTLFNANVRDTTPPSVVSGTSVNDVGIARIKFSEPVDKQSAESLANYRFSSGDATQAILLPDGVSVEITLDKPLEPAQQLTITVNGVKDRAPRGNEMSNRTATLVTRGAVFKSPPLPPKTPQEFKPENLPTKATDPWSINLFCKVDSTPEHLTLIGGFGRATDGRGGTGRYFANFTRGINFWICNRDVGSEVPLDLGKWQMLTATYDGHTVRLYKNGKKIAEEIQALRDDLPQVHVMPLDAWERKRVFQGEVRDMVIWNDALSDSVIQRLWESSPK